jgi:hypothetical protein
MIRRRVLFAPVVRLIATEYLLHRNRIGVIQDERGRSRVIIEHHCID